MILIAQPQMELKKMKRGEIYFANLDPTIGKEIQKKKPVLIISNNASNRMSALITVIPITSNIQKVYPFEVLLEIKDSGLLKPSKVQCHQIRTISKLRIHGTKAGVVDNKVISHIDSALKLHLGIQ